MAGHARSSRQGFPGTQGQATATRQRQGKVRHSVVGGRGGDIEGAGGGWGWGVLEPRVLLLLFNAKLSLELYWRGPRSRELWRAVGTELYLTLHCHRQTQSSGAV